MSNDVMSNVIEKGTNNRRVSPIGGLNRAAIRELCDLHPWDLGRLSTNAGMDRTVLSNFFAGRRPLPQRTAVEFLGQLGMTVTGDLDPAHAYILYVRPGREELARAWVSRIFPNGGRLAHLHDCYERRSDGPVEHFTRSGVALFDGTCAAVVQHASPAGNLGTLPGDWVKVFEVGRANHLLDIEVLPSKKDIVDVVQDEPNYDDAVWDDHRWNDVKREVLAKRLTADDVLEMVRQAPVRTNPFPSKSMFPMLERARRKLPED